MSKAVTIQEDGVAKGLELDVLRVPKMGGGTEDWVPEDGKNLVNIRVKENGTYNASDFGAYGIAEVRVACTANGGAATSTDTEKSIDEKSNPAIKEGARARAFTTKRLATQLTAGGKCRWLQKALVALGTKYISTDNTTHKAEDDGKYGYSQVTVSGISISKTTDPDGNEVVTHTDDTGTVTEIVPSSIRIIQQPAKTTYYGGEQIDYTGMVVRAFKGDGTLWADAKHQNGIIPHAELTLPVNEAELSFPTVTVDFETYFDQPIPYTTGAASVNYEYDAYGGDGRKHHFNGTIVVTPAPNNIRYVTFGLNEQSPLERVLAASDVPTSIMSQTIRYKDGQIEDPQTLFIELTSAYTYQGKTVYFNYDPVNTIFSYQASRPQYVGTPPWPYVIKNDSATSTGPVAWALIYGTPHEGVNTIPVQWERPGDNEVLETSFDITVTAATT